MNLRLTVTYLFINIFVSLCYVETNKLKDWKVKNKLISFYAQKKVAVNWQNGIIPYFFDTKSYDHVIANRLRLAMNVLESVSCIKFAPIIGSPNLNSTWLHISNPLVERDCMHEPRRKDNGETLLVFGLDCLSEQQVLHTLMHGVGFKDEVSHPQRDQYIRILWTNIQPAYHHLFSIQSGDMTPRGGVEYDPMSIMHFHDRAFSINGHATIAPLISGLVIKPSDSLSQLDTMKLRLLFGHECNKRNVDDLLDTCKLILHQDVKQKTKTDSSETKGKITTEGDTKDNNSTTVNNAIHVNYYDAPADEVEENNPNVKDEKMKGNAGENEGYDDNNNDRHKEKIRLIVKHTETDE